MANLERCSASNLDFWLATFRNLVQITEISKRDVAGEDDVARWQAKGFA